MTLKFAPERIEHWHLDRLRAYGRNPRTHSDEQVAQIAASILEFGWTNPILVAADGAGRAPAAVHSIARDKHGQWGVMIPVHGSEGVIWRGATRTGAT